MSLPQEKRRIVSSDMARDSVAVRFGAEHAPRQPSPRLPDGRGAAKLADPSGNARNHVQLRIPKLVRCW